MNMKHLKVLSPCKQKGIASVELAIILPLLVFLWAGTIEAGMAFSRYNNLTKAVRDGARFVSLNLDPDSTGMWESGCLGPITDRASPCGAALSLIQYNTNQSSGTPDTLLPPYGTITVDINHAPAGSNANFSLKATYRHNLITGNLVNSFFGTSFPLFFDLKSTVVMRAQ